MSKRFLLSSIPKIKNQDEINIFFEKGRRICNRYLCIYYIPGQLSRVAFIAGKKIGGAVLRNRCKRLLREVYRLHADKLSSKFDLLCVAKKDLLSCNFQNLEKDFQLLIHQF